MHSSVAGTGTAPRASPAGTSRLAPTSTAAPGQQQQQRGSGGKAAAAANARGQTKVSTFFPAIIDGGSRDSEGGNSAGSAAAAAERASAAAAAALQGGLHHHPPAVLQQHQQHALSSLSRSLSPVAETIHDERAAQLQQALEMREREIQRLNEQLRLVFYNWQRAMTLSIQTYHASLPKREDATFCITNDRGALAIVFVSTLPVNNLCVNRMGCLLFCCSLQSQQLQLHAASAAGETSGLRRDNEQLLQRVEEASRKTAEREGKFR